MSVKILDPSSCIQHIPRGGYSSGNLENWDLPYTSLCGRIHAFNFSIYVDSISLTYGIEESMSRVLLVQSATVVRVTNQTLKDHSIHGI